jgi:two-component system, NtrC family, sensor kinase
VTLRRKLALFLLLATLAPLAGVGFTLLARVQRTLAGQTLAAQRARAAAAAAALGADLARAGGDLQGFLDAWRPDRLSDAERQGLLVVLASRVHEADAAALLDAAGSARAVVDEAAEPGGAASTEAFLAAARAAAPAAGERLVLAVFQDQAGRPALAVARGVRGAGGAWTLAARVAADALARRLDAAAPPGGGAWLLDGGGAPLLASTAAPALALEDRVDVAAALADPAGARAGDRLVAAWAPVADGAGLGVLVALPARVAYADVIATRREVLWASAAVLSLVLGAAALVGRRMTTGLRRLDVAARALGAGDLAVRVPATGGDEIAAVSATFNGMAEELSRARTRLEAWNEDLRREVALRARELEAAHARLLEARKLAALGQLGAGVAHEINNPLAGILGNVQLLLEEVPADHPDRDALAGIEAAARRCRSVTDKLLRFSQQRTQAEPDELELDAVVTDALGLAEAQLRDAGLVVEVSLARPPVRVRGDPGHLTTVLLDLLANARAACAGRPGARVRVSTARDGELARLAVADAGKGIPPENLPRIFEPFFTTKESWTDVGLGLSVAFRIATEHGGRIEAESRVGEGSTFTVIVPALPPAV